MADEGTGAVKSESGVINLIVKDQQSSEVHFKVFAAYCQKKELAQNTVKFIYDSLRLNEEQTPAELNMEDGDSIDCMIEQVGGTC